MRRVDWEIYTTYQNDRLAIKEMQKLIENNAITKKRSAQGTVYLMTIPLPADNMAVNRNLLFKDNLNCFDGWIVRNLVSAIRRTLKKRKFTLESYIIRSPMNSEYYYYVHLMLKRIRR